MVVRWLEPSDDEEEGELNCCPEDDDWFCVATEVTYIDTTEAIDNAIPIPRRILDKVVTRIV